MKKNDKKPVVQWGWTLDEGVRGPFSSKEKALADAKELGETHVCLGIIEYPRPEDCFGTTINVAITDADEVALTSAYREGDDEFFKVRRANKKAAQLELDKFFKTWAKKWVEPCNKIFRFIEEVKIS
jgi:hypothetical protein